MCGVCVRNTTMLRTPCAGFISSVNTFSARGLRTPPHAYISLSNSLTPAYIYK